MEQLYKSQYSVMVYDRDRSFLDFSYYATTAQMTEAEYKIEIARYFECLEQYRPKIALSDLKELYFTISPEVQDWINSTLLAKTPPTKTALVMPSDFFTQVSVEQTVNDAMKSKNNDFQISEDNQTGFRYFEDRKSALTWLMA